MIYIESDDIRYIISRVTKETYNDLVVVSERENINMSDIVEYCLCNIVDEFE